MKTVSGKTVCGGVQFGRIRFYQRESLSRSNHSVVSASEELARFESACKQVKEQLQDCYIQFHNTSKDEAKIFLSHQMFLEDIQYLESVRCMIVEEQLTAQQAVRKTEQELVSHFLSKESDVVRARVADIKDISTQIVDALDHNPTEQFGFSEPTILVTEQLLPSEIIRLSGKKVGVITREVTTYSHVAILAKTMGIPMINTKEDICLIEEGANAIIDGNSGILYVDPDEKIVNQMKDMKRMKENEVWQKSNIQICANMSDVCQMEDVLNSEADGIGLFRSEMIYLKQDSFPTEEQQFQIYKTILENMNGKRVVIRTLDVGGDKSADYLQLPKETNPALGIRGVRYSLRKQDVFKTQLRALLRAGIYGKLAILFPMISSLEEIHQIKEILEEVRRELLKQRTECCESPELGIMVETPAAVIMSKELAKEVDFASVGTNDLTQYTLAVDRQNPAVEEYYNQDHPAVIRMIDMVIANMHAEGKKVSICGDLAADESMFEIFVSMGVDELSVPVWQIESIKKIKQ